MDKIKNSIMPYSVGPLLYCPAVNKTVAQSIIEEKFGKAFSLALCLEDTIDDNNVADAEDILIQTIHKIYCSLDKNTFYLPQIFIRVREPEQIINLYTRLGVSEKLITGFIIPKFSLDNSDLFIEQMLLLNSQSQRKIYMMPILENPVILNLKYRYDILNQLKEKLDKINELVLNIRVGGNDLSHAFGFRRQSTETIYDIRPIADILTDIVTVFGIDFVVSGPVWEYYDGFHWDLGLKEELKKDRQCGFVGKTVIHPKQIELVNKAYMISKNDYEDALAILDWDNSSDTLVSGSTSKSRMNEYKTHYNWAEKILQLSQVYGITEEE